MQRILGGKDEIGSCGVGFIASRRNTPNHEILEQGLEALARVEHRGACAYDGLSGDGAGIMTDIPFKLLGYAKHKVAVASIFAPQNPIRRRQALKIFEDTFQFFGLQILSYRQVPINATVLGSLALKNQPHILHAIIERPEHCSTGFSFDKLLYDARQLLRSKMRDNGIIKEFFFTSLSSKTIVYKGMLRSCDLSTFYPDLQNPSYQTRFVIFHRRFSTNTRTSWDKAQPFRLIGHNGEINTIAGNRSWAYSREKNLGVRRDELLTHDGLSDSGNLNEMVEALRFRSSMPDLEDILALMVPPFGKASPFYEFWSRAMEPWDGPAFITFSDGRTIGARLDRNGFRPCRWSYTESNFYLSSEAGLFAINDAEIKEKGTLRAGSGIMMDLSSGSILFRDPSDSIHHFDVKYDSRLWTLPSSPVSPHELQLDKQKVFLYSSEEIDKILVPMAASAKEPIGSMGDTAPLAILSDQPRSFFDFFYHDFAQVTNPPLDFLREEIVTDLVVYLGRKPNIFKPKQLVPMPPAFRLDSPILNLEQLAYLRTQMHHKPDLETRTATLEIDMIFPREFGEVGFRESLEGAGRLAVEAAKKNYTILILTDRRANHKNPPIPSLLMLRSVVEALNKTGNRLKISVVIDSGEIRTTHQAAALIGFGATAICPWLALQLAGHSKSPKLKNLSVQSRQTNFIKALEQGILKIMSKSGIAVVRSYQSAKLFTAIGLGPKILSDYFQGLSSPVGGLELGDICERILNWIPSRLEELDNSPLDNFYLFREDPSGQRGEKHSATTRRSKLIHQISSSHSDETQTSLLYKGYIEEGEKNKPTSLRHLLKIRAARQPLALDQIQSHAEVLSTFGSGAMSFGAISDEAQRDIILAMQIIGGRSNSGEGGENPFYETHGISASIKQVASGRFGVTARYLINANEIQIKIAQGAKPGEGGQLMGVKVSENIARARYSKPGVDLISPPPLHDIYSIEDLKQLIYELKQLHPGVLVNVKLVAGKNVGTIAVGVAKAGADIIHVSGGDGGTGAASLISMKHCGLPWELGLLEVHRALCDSQLRGSVVLRTDGGLSSGKDILMAAILGAQEFEFGKLLLIAEGCIMARVCEKNTCPAGIATHNEKFKAKYKGSPDSIVRILNLIAAEIREELSLCSIKNLFDLVGRTDLLEVDPDYMELVESRNLDFSFLSGSDAHCKEEHRELFPNPVNDLNQKILSDFLELGPLPKLEKHYPITNTDRAIPATLSGHLASLTHGQHMRKISGQSLKSIFNAHIHLSFTGSAGQGFGVFLNYGIHLRLEGEGNDSVGKGMSGGSLIVVPPRQSKFPPEKNIIIGNCALYGATGGKAFIQGIAGDRFAVRNSGALAVVEGVGLHACEYMTGGVVVILGEALANVGAGMTGGKIFTFTDLDSKINKQYLRKVESTLEDLSLLEEILRDYVDKTDSAVGRYHLDDLQTGKPSFFTYLP